MMKTLVKTLLILAGVVLALGVTFVALLMQPSAVQTSETVTFVSMKPVDISSVTVENRAGTYCYYYEDDGYVLDDIPANIADLSVFIDFMTNCSKLSAIRRIEGEASEANGLTTPGATVELQFFQGNTLRLEIGNQEKISGNYYVAVQGFPGVYLMEQAMAAPFLLPKTQVISKDVTEPLNVTSPLSAIRDITFAGGDLAEPVTILSTSGGDEQVRSAALSFGSATHLVRGAGIYQLDQAYGIEIFGSLFGIHAQGVVGYNLTEEEIQSLGFDHPWMTVDYDMLTGAGEETVHCVLQVVRLADNAFYAVLSGTGAVFLIERQAFMDIQFEKLMLRWFLTPMLMDVSAVTIEGGGQQYRFSIDNADKKNPMITCNQSDVETELFRSFYRLLTSAAHDGAYLGKLPEPSEDALLTITYEYLLPDKSPDIMTLYPGGVRRVNVFVNGAGEFAMKDQFVSRVLAGCQNLLAGQPIEENW